MTNERVSLSILFVVAVLIFVLTHLMAQSQYSNSGITATLSPGALLLGGCGSTTVSVPGARTGMYVEATPTSDPGTGVVWQAWVSSSDNVTVRECALLSITPTATTYNVRVFQ